jgi:two-component system sensor histidine kinase CpxA
MKQLMKVAFPLYLQTLGMLLLYLATLVTIIFFCFNAQFGIGWEAALKSPLGERFDTIAGAISNQLLTAKPENWEEILRSFEHIYHVNLYVFDGRGSEIAGDKIILPPTVAARIKMPPPPGLRFHQHHLEGLDPGPPPWEIGYRDQPGHGPALSSDNHQSQPAPRPTASYGGPQPGPPPPVNNGGPQPGPPPPANNDGPALGPLPGGPPFAGREHFPLPPGNRVMERFLLHTNAPDRFWICARIHVFSPELGFYGPGVLIASCDNLWQSSLLVDFKIVISLLAVVLGLSLVFWWPFIYRITSALSRLTEATESIAQGKFDTRINASGRDEIGRLSEAVDTMAGRLEGYVLEQKRLLADISHEMFSPLARLQLALELLDSGSTDEQQAHIADIREEVEEMNNLISELVAYSKAGMQAKTAELGAVNLKAILEGLIPRLVNANNIVLEIPEQLSVLGDRLLLDRAISNVLRNSVRYAGPNGQIKVSAIAEGGEIVVTIVDNGPGVSEAALKHLGQPFYRPESSRNRASGGFGLGLAIVKSCVEACQGSFALRNAAGGGLAVELRLKAASPA